MIYQLLHNLSDSELHLLIVAALVGMTNDANVDPIHIETGAALQDIDELGQKLKDWFPLAYDHARDAGARIADNEYEYDYEDEDADIFTE